MELPNYAQTSQEVVSYVCWKYMFAENMAMCFAKCAPHRHGVRRRNNCTDKHPPEKTTEPATEKSEAHKIGTQPASDVEDPTQ